MACAGHRARRSSTSGGRTDRFPTASEDYTLLTKLGEGVTATVYLATCQPLRCTVAVKLLDLEAIEAAGGLVRIPPPPPSLLSLSLSLSHTHRRTQCSHLWDRQRFLEVSFSQGPSTFMDGHVQSHGVSQEWSAYQAERPWDLSWDAHLHHCGRQCPTTLDLECSGASAAALGRTSCHL